MEGNLRKRISLSSWMMAGMLALGMNTLWGQESSAATVNDGRSDLASGVYSEKNPATGEWLKLDVTPQPGENPDIGMLRSEDLYQFTSPTMTLSGDGTRIFGWKTAFGERGQGDDVMMSISGGTNIFDNQGIYIGSRSGSDGLGGDTTLDVTGGTNIFTQRVIIGGEGKGSDSVLTGRSTVNLGGGVNIFTYDKRFDWSAMTATCGNKTFTVGDYTGDYSKYLGNGVTASTAAVAGSTPELAYDSVNAYNYYNNYYGVFISAIADKGAAGQGLNGANTKGADLNISGGVNIFNVVTYVGGGYDLNPYGSINTSADDNDVVWGGTNNVNITGGFTNFAGRTYFGAAGSTTNVTFAGKSTTYFTGTAISEDMDYALANMELVVHGNPSFKDSYNMGDMPYVYFGGKDITEMDVTLSRNNNIPLLESDTVVNINGFNKNMTTVDMQTTAFFGGADERWLAGDQYDIVGGTYAWRAEYGNEDVTSTGGAVQAGDNATRKDTGKAVLNLNSGKLRLGYVNTTEIVKTRNSENWNYAYTEPYGKVYEVTEMQKRYEQIRLIGAAEGTTFNSGDARIQFDVSLHADNAGAIAAAADSGYTGFFVDMPETTMNPAGQEVYTLEAGMIAFDAIHLSADTDITVGGIGKMMVRASDADPSVDILGGQREFYTNAVFVDTTNAAFDGTDTTVLLDNSSVVGTDSTFAKTEYNKWFYSVSLEDVDPAYAATSGIQTNQVRLHVQTKDINEALVGNMKRNDETFKDVLAGDGTYTDSAGNLHDISSVQNALEQIVDSSETAEQAAENFDQLIGTTYGNLASAQIRRLSSFNSMLADQIIASDICLKNLRKGATSCGGEHCGQCDACGNCRNWTAWGHFYADGGKAQMHKYIDGYETETYGGMFAIDWTNCESCHFGAFFNYAKSDVDSDAQMGYTHLESEDYAVGLYAKWLGLWCTGGYGTLIAQVNFSDITSERELYLDDSFTGDTDGVIPSVFYERGWVFFPTERLSLNPFFGLQYVYYHSDEFTEDGVDIAGYKSDLALNVSDIDHHSLRTLMGMRISRDWMLGMAHDRRFTTRFKAAWMHDVLGECDPTFTTSHVCSPEYPTWDVRGNNSGRDWAILGLGVDFNASERMAVLFDYNCYVNEYTTIHAGMATMRFSF